MAETNDLDRAVSTVCSKFKIYRLNAFQMKVISEFVKEKAMSSSIYRLAMANRLFVGGGGE